MKIFFRLLLLVLCCSGPAIAKDRLTLPPAKAYTDVPEALKQPFSEAIDSWRIFARQEEAFAKEIASLLNKISPERYSVELRDYFSLMDSDGLHRYLYPWTLTWPSCEGCNAVLPANSPELKQYDDAIENLAEQAGRILEPDKTRRYRKVLASWKAYRNSACRLSAAYSAHIGILPAHEPKALDKQCLQDFAKRLGTRPGELIDRVRLAKADSLSNLPKFEIQGKKLHYLEAADSLPGHEQIIKTIDISDTSAPLIVLLQNYESTHWNIHIHKGVVVQQLILFGYYRQSFKIKGRAPLLVRSYSWEDGNSRQIETQLRDGKRTRLDMRDALTKLVGITPSTMQFGDEGRALIDGKRNYSPPKPGGRPGPVAWKIYGEAIGAIVDGDLAPGGSFFATASYTRNAGRWYFEVQAPAPETVGPDWNDGTVGPVDTGQLDENDLLYRIGFRAGRSRTIKPGETLRVALDLDRNIVYYGADGGWEVGDPVGSMPGISLKKGRTYVPGLVGAPQETNQKAGKWVGRFAERDFRYPPPPGYLAYDQNASAEGLKAFSSALENKMPNRNGDKAQRAENACPEADKN